jgi:hypothetical protein
VFCVGVIGFCIGLLAFGIVCSCVAYFFLLALHMIVFFLHCYHGLLLLIFFLCYKVKIQKNVKPSSPLSLVILVPATKVIAVLSYVW